MTNIGKTNLEVNVTITLFAHPAELMQGGAIKTVYF